jgi:hypothetical protein
MWLDMFLYFLDEKRLFTKILKLRKLCFRSTYFMVVEEVAELASDFLAVQLN